MGGCGVHIILSGAHPSLAFQIPGLFATSSKCCSTPEACHAAEMQGLLASRTGAAEQISNSMHGPSDFVLDACG